MNWEQIQAYIAVLQPAVGEQERMRQYYAVLDTISPSSVLQDAVARLLAAKLHL